MLTKRTREELKVKRKGANRDHECHEDEELVRNATKMEAEDTIQSLKNNKPPAENRVASELLKYVGDKFTQFFFELTSQI